MKKLTIVLIISSFLIFCGCDLFAIFNSGSAIMEVFTDHNYRYAIDGTADSYNIIIADENGNKLTWENVSSDWEYSWDQNSEKWRYISAKNNDGYGTVTVKLYRNEDILVSNTTYGGRGTASVSGFY